VAYCCALQVERLVAMLVEAGAEEGWVQAELAAVEEAVGFGGGSGAEQ
jgi:hypothetical protein